MALKDEGAKRPGRLLTKREVAEWLSVSVRTLCRLVASGALPAPVKVGACSRFCPEDIAAYIERCRRQRR